MMNIKILKMSESHLQALSLIEEQCFSTPWSENALRDELSNKFARFFVCEKDGECAGYIGAHNVLGEVYITNAAVSPSCRRQGIGEALIKHLTDFCKSENADFITLEVRKSNLGAIALYEKCDFSFVGERKAFYENPREDAILMTYYFK